MIFDLHALEAREYACDVVVIDGLQNELNIGKHDVGCTARDEVEAIPVFLPGLDSAFSEFAPDSIGFNDEPSPMNAGEFGKIDLLRAATANKNLVTFIDIGRPSAGQL